MNTRVSGAFTLLDLSKSAVEHFLKTRGNLRNPSDRYLLVTTDEEGQDSVRLGYGDKAAAFSEQVKKLTATSEQPETAQPPSQPPTAHGLSHAISRAFQFLTQFRLQTDVDNYGRGRAPWMLEPAAVIVLTDGASLRPATLGAKAPIISLTFNRGLGADLSSEPFRWDHRLFAMVVSTDPSPAISQVPEALKAMADVTGGWHGCAPNLQILIQKMDLILHKLSQIGPVVQLAPTSAFEQIGPQPQFQITRALLNARNENPRLWPIPEAFWCEKGLDVLPPRTAQPLLLYQRSEPGTKDTSVTSLDLVERLGLPVDWYELEWCGQPLNMGRAARWAVFLANSSRQRGKGEPFGFLRASPNAGRVLFANLPYNYPKLLPLLKQATELLQSRQGMLSALSASWKGEFNQWLFNTPVYYNISLRKALKRFGLASLIQERPDGGLSKHLIKRLTRLREQCKSENDKLEQGNKQEALDAGGGREKNEKNSLQGLFQIPVGNLLEKWEEMRSKIFGSGGITVTGLYTHGPPNGIESRCLHRKTKQERGCNCRGKGNCPQIDWEGRGPGLLARVAASLAPTKPISEMSNYVEVLLSREVLRDPLHPEEDEDTPQGVMRRKLAINFGNPFRLKPSKPGQSRLMVDEAAAEAELLMAESPRPHDDPDQDMEEDAGNKQLPTAVDGTFQQKEALKATANSICKDSEGRLGEKRSFLQLPRLEKRQRQKPPAKKPHVLPQAIQAGEDSVQAPENTNAPSTPIKPVSPRSVPGDNRALDRNPTLTGKQGSTAPPNTTPVYSSSTLQQQQQPQQKIADAHKAASGDGTGQMRKVSHQQQQQQQQTHLSGGTSQNTSTAQVVLPEGWIVCFSKREQRHYYFNTRTNESRWIPPPGSTPVL